MNWYLVKLVYRIVCGSGDHTAQFDEQLRLISATSERSAILKANEIGSKEQESFYNQKKQLVQWIFIGVSEAIPFTEMIDGAEVYSRINEVDNAEFYTGVVRKKAASLLKESHDPIYFNQLS